MKCPKCGYLGFERVDRCRNCGYEFTLAQGTPPPELSLQRDADASGNLEELGFLSERRAALTPSTDLPLFAPAPSSDEPLITRPSAPRQPLAVRRATPERPRLSVEPPRSQTFDLAFEPESSAIASRTTVVEQHGKRSSVLTPGATVDAGLLARLFAAGIDVFLLGVVDVVVVYLTLQICGLSLSEAGVLPKGPLIAFLLVQNIGYLSVFTAGGQTLGKMAVGIRVVAADEREPLDLGRAVVRTLVWAALAMPAGLGFLTTLTRDRRGLHDRFAGTRVVRAAA